MGKKHIKAVIIKLSFILTENVVNAINRCLLMKRHHARIKTFAFNFMIKIKRVYFKGEVLSSDDAKQRITTNF